MIIIETAKNKVLSLLKDTEECIEYPILKKMEDFIKSLLIVLYAIVLAGIAAFITGLIIWPLWNWLMPTIFNLPEVTYIQACGISWLCGCLFKSVSYNKK